MRVDGELRVARMCATEVLIDWVDVGMMGVIGAFGKVDCL